MKRGITMSLNSSSTHSLRVVELAIASVWVSFVLLANVQALRDLSIGGYRSIRKSNNS
jgi:hypothetical protein